MKVDDEPLLGLGEHAVVEAGPEVVGPAEPAALAAPLQAGQLRHRPPAAAAAVGGDEFRQPLVLLRRPRPPLHPLLVAARPPPHDQSLTTL